MNVGTVAKRAALAGAAVWGLAGGATAGLWYQLFRRPLPRTTGDLRVPGIEAPIEISRDRWGVPHVRAETDLDLWFGQGFCHGQDRLWQVDLYRRIGSGRLSEIAGTAGLVTDRFIRTLGLRRVAEREAAGVAPDIRARLDAYCAGVNAAAADRPLPVEFQVLRQRFEAFVPADALTMTKLLSYGLSTNWERELLRAEMTRELGPDVAARLDPGYPAGNPVVLTPGAGWSGDGLALAEQIAKVRGTIGLAVEATGSNNWAVSGERSATGGPLMAGDPHLPPSMPGITYQVGLYLGDRFCRGASLPGLPGVTMGQNNDVAWTFTNVMADVMDLFIERIDGDEYELEWRAPAPRGHRRGDRRQGPGVARAPRGPRDRARADRQRVSACRRRGAARAALLSPRLAGDHRGELRRARLRRRPRAGRGACGSRSSRVEPGLGGSPRFDRLQDGRPDPAAKGRLPRSAEARLDGRVRVGGLDPLRGAAATRRSRRRASSSRPTTVSLRRITRTTSRATTWTATGRNGSRSCFRRAPSTIWRASSRFRRTCYSIPGLETAHRLARLSPARPARASAIERLRSWDGGMGPDSIAATIYQAFTLRLAQEVARAAIADRDLIERWLDRADNGFVAHVTSPWRWQAHLLTLWEEGDDDLVGRPWDDLVLDALRGAIDDLESAFGPDQEAWRWGRVHPLVFPHALGAANPFFARIFNRRLEVGGGQETVAQVG